MERKRSVSCDHDYALQLFCCKLCHKEFRNKYALAQHKQHDHEDCVHQKTLHFCKVCNKIFPTKYKLHCHSVVNHKKKAKFYCKICKTYWIIKDMFLAHISTHAGEKRLYTCVECNRKYKTLWKFKVHRALHYEKKLQGECQLCSKQFSNAQLLRMHKCERAETLLVPVVKTEVTDRPLLVAVYKPYIEKHEYQGLNPEQANSSVDFNQLDGKNNPFRLILPKPWNAPTPDTFQCQVCRNFFPSMSVLRKDSLKLTKPEYICKLCDELLNQQSKHKPTKQSNKSMQLNSLKSLYTQIDLIPKPYKSEENVSENSDNKILPKPVNDPTPNTFHCKCKVCLNLFPAMSVLRKDSLESTIPEYICRPCDELLNPQSNHEPTKQSNKSIGLNNLKRIYTQVSLILPKPGKSDNSDSRKKSINTNPFNNKIPCNLIKYEPKLQPPKNESGDMGRKYFGRKVIKCEECSETFPSVAILRKHMKESTCFGKPGTYTCRSCGKQYSFWSALVTHKKVGVCGSKLPECGVCKLIFNSKGEFQRHLKTSKMCGSYPSRISRNYKCKKCGRKFGYIKSLNDHQDNCNVFVKRDFQCSVCNITVRGEKRLNRHMVSHTKEKTHECVRCGERFLYTNYLYIHYRENEQCGKGVDFPKLSYDPKELMCEFCGKRGFTDRSVYNNHVRSRHPGEDNLVCENCDARLSCTNSLRKHKEYSCLGNKQCDICHEKGFQNKRQFVKHMRIHNSQYKIEMVKVTNKYKCVKCPQTFTHGHNLARHVAHVCAGGLICHVCGFSDFQRKAQFYKHVFEHETCHSLETLFPEAIMCRVCYRTFDTDAEKHKHLRNVHVEIS